METETPTKDGTEAASLPTDIDVPHKTEPANEEAETQAAAPANAAIKTNGNVAAKSAPRAAKTSSAQRARTVKRAPRSAASRTTKSTAKFAPFNGALSGLLSPPANKRK